jgi:hypothetical protein
MKTGCTVYVIKKLQIKAAVRSKPISLTKNQKTDITEKLVRMWRTGTLDDIADERGNGTGSLQNSLSVFYQSKPTFTMQCSSHCAWYLARGIENLRPLKSMYTDV